MEGESGFSDADLEWIALYTLRRDRLWMLKEHIERIQKDLLQMNPKYRCIERGTFIEPRLPRHPQYNKLINMVTGSCCGISSDITGVIVDVGACVGTDLRGLAQHGVSADKMVALDLNDLYWKKGLELFEDHHAMRDVALCWCDITKPEADDALKAALHGRPVCAFTSVSVLHTMSREQVLSFVQRAYSWLREGGIFLGWTWGSSTGTEGPWPNRDDRWLHSEASLAKVLHDAGFLHISVVVKGLTPQDTPTRDGMSRMAFFGRKGE